MMFARAVNQLCMKKREFNHKSRHWKMSTFFVFFYAPSTYKSDILYKSYTNILLGVQSLLVYVLDNLNGKKVT